MLSDLYVHVIYFMNVIVYWEIRHCVVINMIKNFNKSGLITVSRPLNTLC